MIEGEGSEADPDDVFPAIDELRIPVAYLANMLTAGEEEPVRLALRRLAAMRSFMREQSLGGEPDPSVAARVGLEPAAVERLFRLLAIAHYDERYVVPKAHTEVAGEMNERQGAVGIAAPTTRFTRRLM
jgi:nitrate reductase beta subunit